MFRLKSHLNAPPGSFSYEQTQGIYRKFDATPLIDQLAYLVADFRKGNQLPGATFEEALADVDFYNCQRLGFMERWCYNTDKSFAQTSIPPKRGCGTCGHR